jgi:hypothetical protein
VAERGIGDETLDLHEEMEAPRLAAWQDLRIGLGFEHAHSRLIDNLDTTEKLDIHVTLVTGQ